MDNDASRQKVAKVYWAQNMSPEIIKTDWTRITDFKSNISVMGSIKSPMDHWIEDWLRSKPDV